MKRLLSKLIPVAAAAALTTTLVAAPKETVYATGKLEIDKKLADKAKGIRTVFISIYDATSPAPRPYAATKLDIAKDANGAFQDFKLTPENIMAMGSGPVPSTMRIKAKLDKDGSAGPDASGDVTGTVDQVKVGASNVVIKLDKYID